MIVLLDTSTPLCKLTIFDGNYSNYEWQAGRELSDGLLKFLQEKLTDHSRELNEIEGIGVMKGPGSFTGLRIGLSVLNALADTASIPIVGVVGASWQNEAMERLKRGEDDKIVLPEYGGKINITKPRK